MVITFCDLCGKTLYDNKSKAKHYKLKEHKWFGDCSGWVKCDVHEECVKKLFDRLYNEEEENKE